MSVVREPLAAQLLSSSVPCWQHSSSERWRQQFNFISPGGTPTMKSLQKEVNSLLLPFASKYIYFFQAHSAVFICDIGSIFLEADQTTVACKLRL